MSDPFAPISGGAGKHRDKPQFRAVTPVPPDAPAPPDRHPKLGLPSTRWTYRDSAGEIVGYVCRFDTRGGEKEFRPLVLFEPAAGGSPAWRWEAWPVPRSLYGLDKLAQNLAAPVVVTEGEKAADAAQKLLPSHVAVTSPNGSKSAAKADWSPLRGRSVVIWPDADDAGAAYVQAVINAARTAGAASVCVVALPSNVKDGWDAADALDNGWTRNQALDLVRTAGRAEPFSVEPEAANGGRRRVPQRDNLMGLTQLCDLWHAEDGKAFTTFPVNGHRETWPIRSEAFKRWLACRAYEELGLVPGAQAVEDTLRVLEARATNEGQRRAPWLRVGARDGRLYIDLCDASWRAIEIRSDGWSVLEKHDLPFIRSRAMHPLPEPEGGYAVEELRRFVNVASDEDFVLVVAWIIAALRERGPYPILVINGEQGSGKSTFTRLIRSIVDPNAAPIRAAPREERDLITWAANGHVIAIDNMSKVAPELSDGLCRLATGGGFAARQLHTDLEESVFMGTRPIILNGIPLLTDRPDLADRAVTIRLSAIREDSRRPEDDVWQEWAEVAPRVLGAVCDALSAGVRCVGQVKLTKSPRLADFAKWITAAERGLGWEPGTFAKAYGENRRDVTDSAFESDTVAVAIRDLLSTQECREYGWQGTATDLLEALNAQVSEAAKRQRSWPLGAPALGNRIERIAPLLRSKGFQIERKHSGIRTITITPIR